MEHLLHKLQGWAAQIQLRHDINPWLFLALMAGCAPFFYYSIYRLARAAAVKDGKSIKLWSAIFLAATVLPYLYVMAFGRNLPWYVYLLLAALVGQGLWSLLKKVLVRRSRNE